MKIIESFEENIDNPLKKIHENVGKQVEALKEGTIPLKNIEKHNQRDEGIKQDQDQEVEIDIIMNTQMEATLEMKNLGKDFKNYRCKHH